MAKGRITLQQREEKQRQGRQLFASGLSLSDISNIIKVTEKTLRDWRDKGNWEEEKELATLKPSRLKRLTLKCALAIEKGEPLPYKADDISKIVAAFDRVTDSRKQAVYFMESMDMVTLFMLEMASKAKGQKRTKILDDLKKIRPYADKLITKLLQDD